MAENILGQSPLFRDLSDELLEAIEMISIRERHAPGVMLFEAGQPADYIYILERGNVALVILTEAREEVIVSTISTPGDVLAWSALVDPRVLTANGECLAETTVLRLEGQKLEALFDEHPHEGQTVMRRLASLIATRLKDTQRRLIRSIS
jgi:CRP-like cAMP-binding protein